MNQGKVHNVTSHKEIMKIYPPTLNIQTMLFKRINEITT